MSPFDVLAVSAVALRKESVDRNMLKIGTLRSTHKSLSARRAWIEISDIEDKFGGLVSLSARRAWIEIKKGRARRPGQTGRSPQGERG